MGFLLLLGLALVLVEINYPQEEMEEIWEEEDE